MSEPRPSVIALAAAITEAEASVDDGWRGVDRAVMTKLYASLGKLIGPSGFDVLLARALKLAQRDEPTLSNVTPDPGGALKGLVADPAVAKRGLVAVLTHLFELLSTFIGEDLVTRVVRDAWPHVTDADRPRETER